ncbi:hypothetical protein DWX58_01560 [Pseudoflavonifractor sp. AF19-9AC]|nr:hypothetical protein DWX58_01560 [Pseudoflavonifractor sp. AF19-9AC]
MQKVVHGLFKKLGQTALGAAVGVAVDGVDHIGIGDQSAPIVGLLAGTGHFNQTLNAELEGIHSAVIHKASGGEEGMLAAELPFGEVVDGALHHLGITGILVGNGLLDRQLLHNLILDLFFTHSFTLLLNE